MKRVLVAAAAGLALTFAGASPGFTQTTAPAAPAPVSAPVAAPAPPTASPILTLSSVDELKKAGPLTPVVATRWSANQKQGYPQLFQILDKEPTDPALKRIGVPLTGGRYAIPANLRHEAPAAPTQNLQDVVDRSRSFVAAGRNLEWTADPEKPSPVATHEVVHDLYDAPWGVSCSAFAAMVLYGYSYESTTYVASKNTVVGSGIDFGPEHGTPRMMGANRLAQWFHNNGRLWMPKSQKLDDVVAGLAVGDILFFSHQKPENKDQNTGEYFGNVYHTAVYIGHGTVVHSYGPTTPSGVVEEPIQKAPMGELSFIARPDWQPSGSGWSLQPTPWIQGSVGLGSQLKAQHRDFAPAAEKVTYQWKRSGNPIPGATSAEYTVAPEDVFADLTVTVTAARPGLPDSVRTSAPATVPALEGTPSIKGTVKVGSTVQAFSNSWYPYVKDMRQQWLIDGKPVPGATQRRYTPTAADRGKQLSVRVTIVRDRMPDVERTTQADVVK
ncbi:MAG: hypothetical protein Q4G45_11600 [Actinomycetia bacterium]|nr:hypothetical protein [Actinomycetes bacterium]